MVTPRYSMLSHSSELEKARQILGGRSESVIIVGNGPSVSEVDYSKLPKDAYVFRCNWFFLEAEYRFNRHVDLYFWSVYNKHLHERLRKIKMSGEYTFGAFCCPFVIPEDNNDFGGSYNDVLTPQLDHWAIMCTVSELGRPLMSRPLPTQGMQMLATALALGYRDIHLVGIDFYMDANNRYFFNIPDDVRVHLKEKDYRGGYEEKHSLSMDIRYLELCARMFPDAKIWSQKCPVDLAEILRKPEPCAQGGFRRIIEPAKLADGAEREPTFALRTNSVTGKEEKVAYVTYVNRSFQFGLWALANSLAEHTDIPLIAMVAPEDADLCDGLKNAHACVVKNIDNPNKLARNKRRFATTYTKLNVFGLSYLDKAVFLDADVVVLKNIDNLFDHDRFAAAPDTGINMSDGGFNSGVFVCQPSPELFSAMLGTLRDIASSDGGDQGFLNRFFDDFTVLDRKYNTLKRLHRELPILFDLDEIAVLHFVGVKPWGRFKEPNSEYVLLEKLWFKYLTEDQKVMVISFLRSQSIEAFALIKELYGEDAISVLEKHLKKTQAQKALAAASPVTLVASA
ncbi:alpha-2,3-sialyltransferase [Methylopila turkensis]|uniref:Uncharacterized protein n=1 Tax=Methylopila turkensis TaxID=1437816 RepID=A0A9W6N7X9_9HYPH|nr:alpha-2,3-sialyltransferase [Methylopila turkensis]GLK80890.1 hypothetical protein GCM10008174_26310 [Methylopila turkensis]